MAPCYGEALIALQKNEESDSEKTRHAARNGPSPAAFVGRIGMITCRRFRNEMEQRECLNDESNAIQKENCE